MSKTQKFLLVLIMFLAVFFRYYKINEMPGGLFPDEAANGLDINLMQAGHLQPFYERGNGREALFFYMEWASTSLFGLGPWQLHIVSALGGVLAVLFCFLVTKRLFMMDAGLSQGASSGGEFSSAEDAPRRRAVNIALLAAFLMAVSSWHVVLSRTAFRATLIPLFTAMTFYFLLCAYQEISGRDGSRPAPAKAWVYSCLTGASFALGFYTYIAYRIMAPILLMVLLWPLIGVWKNGQLSAGVKKYFWPAVCFIAAFIIFFYPLGKYFYSHPGSFVGRAGQVSVFNQTLYTVNGVQLTSRPPLFTVVSAAGEVFKRQFSAFFTQGDLNWRQNISGYPFLSPLVSPFFAVGLLLMLALAIGYFFAPAKRAKNWKYFFLAGWFFGMLLPVVATAEGIPHGLRGIGVIPSVFIISAWALYEFGALMVKAHNRLWQHRDQEDVVQGLALPSEQAAGLHYGANLNGYRVVLLAMKILVACFCLALILQTYFLYFVYAYNDPANFYYFRSDLTPVSEYLRDYASKNNTFLVLDKYSVQTTDYLTTVDGAHPQNPKNMPYIQVDPENAWQLSGLKRGDQIVFTQSSVFDTVKFKKNHPEARLALEYRNKFNQAVMAVYKVY
jgi:4-amino-4-deoxy-L-arabinose transferase-like glycosyltransferase